MEAFDRSLPDAHRRFFETLLLWHEDENGIYVHAGIPPGQHPRDCTEEDLLWIRERFIGSDFTWGKPVVFGHTPQYDPAMDCLLYTSDAADERSSVDLGGRRIIK